jgi:hypothetical protein
MNNLIKVIDDNQFHTSVMQHCAFTLPELCIFCFLSELEGGLFTLHGPKLALGKTFKFWTQQILIQAASKASSLLNYHQ